jgi:ATP-binding cassette subfamily B (MDR/TAP) protein 1
MVPNTLSDFELQLDTHRALGQAAPNLQAFAKAKAAAYKIFEMVKQKPTINSVSIIDVRKQLQDLQGHFESHNVEFS